MKKTAILLTAFIILLLLAACTTSPASIHSPASSDTNSSDFSLAETHSQPQEFSEPEESQSAVSSLISSSEETKPTEPVNSAPIPTSEQSSSQPSEEPSSSEPEKEQDTDMKKKTLVVYFSATGTTKPLAEYAAEISSGDLYEIVAAEPYTSADLAYYTGGRADQEQDDPSVRPAITGAITDISQYDTIILGYPIWHGQAPRIISTFLESYDFSGKTIIPFCTSHSSGVGSSADNLHNLCSGETNWEAGKRFPAGTSKTELEAWLTPLLER